MLLGRLGRWGLCECDVLSVGGEGMIWWGRSVGAGKELVGFVWSEKHDMGVSGRDERREDDSVRTPVPALFVGEGARALL